MAEKAKQADEAPEEAKPEEAPRQAKRHPACPVCAKPLAVYAGHAPHKQGTGWCDEHGRQSLGG